VRRSLPITYETPTLFPSNERAATSIGFSQPPLANGEGVYRKKDTGRRVSDHLLIEADWLQTVKNWLLLPLVLLPILRVLKASAVTHATSGCPETANAKHFNTSAFLTAATSGSSQSSVRAGRTTKWSSLPAQSAKGHLVASC
jgi:hypothetical protein